MEKLYGKIIGKREHVDVVLRTLLENAPPDVIPYILEGLKNVSNIVLALPFTRYSWLLVIYEAVGRTENNTIIVYFNTENVDWTLSTIVHELTHKTLNISHRTILDVIIDETLAYLASFKYGFLRLYEKGLREAVSLLSKHVIAWEERELINIYIPRIIARGLVNYNFTSVVKSVTGNFSNLTSLWLKSEPEENAKIALSNALSAIGLSPETYCLKRYECRKETRTTYSRKTILEGIDRSYVEMKEILEEIVKEPSKLKELLSPWWNEVEPILNDIKAYIAYRRLSSVQG